MILKPLETFSYKKTHFNDTAQTFLRIHLVLPAVHFILLINIRYLLEDLPNRVSGSILGFTLSYKLC